MNNISIIAVATNYTYHIYRNFICSLYNTGYEGECFILIDEKSIPETRGLRGTFIPIEKYIPNNLDIHIQNYRLKIYQNILLGQLEFYTLLPQVFRRTEMVTAEIKCPERSNRYALKIRYLKVYG